MKNNRNKLLLEEVSKISEKKIILQEINRIREMMGISLLVEANVTPLVKKSLQFMGVTDNFIDNVIGKTADDATESLNKAIADELTSLGVKNIDELMTAAAQRAGKLSADDVTAEMFIAFAKENPAVQSVIKNFVTDSAREIALNSMAKAEVDEIIGTRTIDMVDDVMIAFQKNMGDPATEQAAKELSTFLKATQNGLEARGIPAEKLKEVGTMIGAIDDLAETSKSFNTKMSSTTSDVVDNAGGRVGDDVVDNAAGRVGDEVGDDVVGEVIDINPTDFLDNILDSYKSTVKKEFPDVPEDAIDNILNDLRTVYGRLDYQTLTTKIDEIGEQFSSKLKKLQDEADEFIKQGQIDKANKKKAQIENLKKGLKFLSDNKITRACIGSSSKVKPGTMGRETISTVDFSWKTVPKTIGCLTGGIVLLNFGVNLLRDPMDREFVACPLVNAVGGCSILPAGWCQVTCGQRTENYVDVNDCFGTLPGWSDMGFKSKNALMALGLDCSYRQKEVAPEKFITSIKYFPGAGGGVEYWIITMNGVNYTVNATKGLPDGKSTQTPNPNPNPNPNTYTNDPTGYKKYVNDKGGTYGTSGNYVMEDGTPFYKDASGNWQAGSYNGTTFVTN